MLFRSETDAGVGMSCRGKNWQGHHVQIGVSGSQVTAQMRGTDDSPLFERHVTDWRAGIRTAVERAGRRDLVIDELKVIGAPVPPELQRPAAATRPRRKPQNERVRDTPKDSGGDQR